MNTNCNTKQAVLRALDSRRAVSVIELAALMEEHPIAINRCCNELQQNEYIRQIAGGVYTITNKGEVRLPERSLE